jgi:hypothetical protein
MFGEVQCRSGGISASFALVPVIVSIGGGGLGASDSIVNLALREPARYACEVSGDMAVAHVHKTTMLNVPSFCYILTAFLCWPIATLQNRPASDCSQPKCVRKVSCLQTYSFR